MHQMKLQQSQFTKIKNGKRHIVLTLKFGFDEEVLYIGNVVDNKSYD